MDRDDVEDFKSITAKEFETYFEKNFIVPIRNKRAEYLYYDNKDIYDSYEEK